MDKTDNSLIFIERDTALSAEEIDGKIKVLREACDTGDDEIAKEALRNVVPTFRKPEEVNNILSFENKQDKEKAQRTVAAF